MHRTGPAVQFLSVERGSVPARPVIGPTLSLTGRRPVMRSTHAMILLLLAPLFCGASCQTFSKDDEALLAKYDGLYIPTGEGPAVHVAPVDAVIFDSPKRALNDADFARVFPAVAHMDPYRLHVRGEHTIGDDSVDLLNKLGSLRVLDVSGTKITLQGLKELKVKSLNQLYISPDNFTEAQLQEIQKALPSVKVSRFRT
jgi:hypothetical protein